MHVRKHAHLPLYEDRADANLAALDTCGCRIAHPYDPYEATWAYSRISSPSRSWSSETRPGDAVMINGRGRRVVASAGVR